jgi:hypothetical protein
MVIIGEFTCNLDKSDFFNLRDILIIYIKVYGLFHNIDFCYYETKSIISYIYWMRYDIILIELFL